MFDLRVPILVLAAAVAPPAHAASAAEFEHAMNATLKRIYVDVPGASGYLIAAKGILVFPKIDQAGIGGGRGGARGEGALRVYGWTEDHYNAEGSSAGLRLDAEAKSVIIIFTDQNALDHFREKDLWRVGVDGAVTMVDVRSAKSGSADPDKHPIVGFVFGQTGLMQDLNLEGVRFCKIQKQ